MSGGKGVDVLAVMAWIDSLPAGFRFPEKPAPRASGYLDNSGVEWNAYDTGHMEAYAVAAYNDGFRAGFDAGCDAVMTPAYKADAEAVSDAAIDAAIAAYNGSYAGGQREWMRKAICAALAKFGGAA